MTIKDICKKKRITQKELGAATGIAQSSISMYISGRKRPTYDTARKMANVLGITVEDLFACLPNVDGKILTMVLAARELGIGINLSKLAVLNITRQPVK